MQAEYAAQYLGMQAIAMIVHAIVSIIMYRMVQHKMVYSSLNLRYNNHD